MEVKRVLERKDGVKMVIIPKKSKIKKGDPVLITGNLKLINKFLEEETNERQRRKAEGRS